MQKTVDVHLMIVDPIVISKHLQSQRYSSSTLRSLYAFTPHTPNKKRRDEGRCCAQLYTNINVLEDTIQDIDLVVL